MQSYASDCKPDTPATLALWLVIDEVRPGTLTNGAPVPDGVRLTKLLADADFVAWDITNHTFSITPAAALRVAARCANREPHFVVATGGTPIYVGMFGYTNSSKAASGPIVLTDAILADCFMGQTNVPPEVQRMIDQQAKSTIIRDPQYAERQRHDLLKRLTNSTTNVTLRIDRRLFGDTPPDKRSDTRIESAVEKLFRKEKQ